MVRSDWMNLNGVWDLRKGVIDEAYSADSIMIKRYWCRFLWNRLYRELWKKATNNVIGIGELSVIPESMKGKKHIAPFRCCRLENGRLCKRNSGRYAYRRL